MIVRHANDYVYHRVYSSLRLSYEEDTNTLYIKFAPSDDDYDQGRLYIYEK